MIEFLFREDSYLRETPARVVGVTNEGGIVLDRTVSTPRPAGSRPIPGCCGERMGRR